MDVLPLKNLQTNLLFNVLKKLPNAPLCRLRQTCSFMDSFAEEHKKKLSSRETDDLKITIGSSFSPTSILTLKIGGEGREIQIPIEKFDFEKQTSGVTIKEFMIFFMYADRKPAEEKLLEILPQIPECKKIFISHLTLETTLAAIRMTSVRSNYTLNLSDVSVEVSPNFFLTAKTDENLINFAMEKLREDSKRGFFRIQHVDSGTNQGEGLFDRVKYFNGFRFKVGEMDLNKFLKDIFYATNLGNLRKISFFFDSSIWPDVFKIEGVNFKTLFQYAISEEIKEKLGWCGSIQIPTSIRTTAICGKIVVIIEKVCSFGPHLLEICIVETEDEIWRRVFKALELEAEEREQLKEMDDEEKKKMMMEFFNENVKGLLENASKEDEFDEEDEDGEEEEEEEEEEDEDL